MSDHSIEQKLEQLVQSLSKLEKTLGRVEYQIKEKNAPILTDSPATLENRQSMLLPPAILRVQGSFQGALDKCIERSWVKWLILPATLAQKMGLFGAIGMVVAVIGLLSAYSSLRFDVSVMPLATLDALNATETRFLIRACFINTCAV